MEKVIDYVMGSGNHARTYLYRSERDRLFETPLGWYAEKGGYWAMNPGYDRADHEGFRRPITYDCMFCHNAYPKIPEQAPEPVYQADLPEGIDCQRCHGPGAKHVQLAKSRAQPQEVRNAIVNPKRLASDRQMEACMVCHLETTSFPLPNALQRFDRGPFSYQPGEPLSNFIVNFDNKGRDDKFEIVSSAYRLRKSACFLKSNGKLQCTTCHNPHEAAKVEAAACLQCHLKHTDSLDCVGCHMPQRRTEDVVHAVMTDHYIQRRQTASIAEIAERRDNYKGPVIPYYPKTVDDLYLAVAQVQQRSNLKEGIVQLTRAIATHRPDRPEFYLALADAYKDDGQLAKALPLYRDAARRNPQFSLQLGAALRRLGQNAESLEQLNKVPDNAKAWEERGLTYRALGKTSAAVVAFRKAIELDPDMAQAHNNLGILLVSESEFREAIRIQPSYADAHYNYAILFGQTRRFDDAQKELGTALRNDPDLADAHLLLANMLMAKGQSQAAVPHFKEVLRLHPDSTEARAGLAEANKR